MWVRFFYYLVYSILILSPGEAADAMECLKVIEKPPEGLFLVVNLLWTERMGLSIGGIEIRTSVPHQVNGFS